ncbi:MAG: hypothetical protein H0X45_03560 [Planctomycetes bacterium]|nr:hypothetical protein [Planctomycetota bacterium]
MEGFRHFQPAWDDGFYRLFTKAGAEQWSVGNLPWAELGEVDADWRDGMIALLSPLLVSERGAMQACGTMLPQTRERGDADAELVMHAMMLDEARHWEGLNRVFLELKAVPTPLSEWKEMLGVNYLIMRGGSFDQWLWGIQICDIMAGHLYATFKASTESKPIQEMFGGFLRDEKRHHRFCQLYFAREAANFTPEQRARWRVHGRKLVGKFEKMMCGRLADDLRRIGADPNDLAQKMVVSVERQADQYGFVAEAGDARALSAGDD